MSTKYTDILTNPDLNSKKGIHSYLKNLLFNRLQYGPPPTNDILQNVVKEAESQGLENVNARIKYIGIITYECGLQIHYYETTLSVICSKFGFISKILINEYPI